VIIDHNSKRLILVITQTVMMLQAFVLAWLTFSGLVGIELIIALSAVLGVANAFDAPARQAFLVELVEGKENLSNAIALNSTMFSLARAVGPSIGGIIAGTLGAAWAFMINGISFLAILISLFVMRVPPSEIKTAHQSPFRDLAEGWRYISGSQAVIGLLGVALMISIFGASLTTLLPVITRDVLGGDEIVFGLLNGAIGVGSIIGGLIMAYLSRQSGRGKNLSILNLLFPIMLAIFAVMKTYQLSALLLIGAGIAFIPQFSLCNMLLQSIIPDDLRGRVMSIYTLVIFGGTPLGGLISAGAAEHIGAPLTIVISAICMGVTAVALRMFIPEINALD
jgi:MFS family permease